MLNMFSLTGKTALVTGGARGIGRALAEGLSKAGANVAIFDLEVCPGLDKNIRAYQVDLSKRLDIETAFNQFVGDYEAIDVLINNAAITLPGSSEDYSFESWQATVDVNLHAVFVLSQLAGKHMISRGRGGSIINVTSIGAHQGFPQNPAYGTTKGAVRQLTKALAADWGQYGIRVNNLSPGYAHTPMNEKSWNDPVKKQQRADHTFLGRWAEPQDLVGPAIFLASEASAYMTAVDLLIDGGWVAKGI